MAFLFLEKSEPRDRWTLHGLQLLMWPPIQGRIKAEQMGINCTTHTYMVTRWNTGRWTHLDGRHVDWSVLWESCQVFELIP